MSTSTIGARWDDEYRHGRYQDEARLRGLDLSGEAIRQLIERRPGQSLPVAVADFRSYEGERPFAYLVAIQVFQHGHDDDAACYFTRAAAALRSGGLFFLRVNSSATQVYHRNTVLERNTFGGFTVRYDAGPKAGLPVHFYSRDELLARARDAFELVMEPRHEVIHRAPPQTGSWAQWEVIWRKT